MWRCPGGETDYLMELFTPTSTVRTTSALNRSSHGQSAGEPEECSGELRQCVHWIRGAWMTKPVLNPMLYSFCEKLPSCINSFSCKELGHVTFSPLGIVMFRRMIDTLLTFEIMSSLRIHRKKITVCCQWHIEDSCSDVFRLAVQPYAHESRLYHEHWNVSTWNSTK